MGNGNDSTEDADKTEEGESNGTVNILVVDDEKDVADLYEAILSREYEVEKAYGGEEALEKISEEIDIVFLDRRMPDLSGDEVLEKIRENDSLNPRVIMLTAVSPDFDIIDMGFDDYLTKPVDRDCLYDAVEDSMGRNDYDSKMDEYMTLMNKKTALQSEKSQEELEESEEYQQLTERINELMEELDDLRDTFVDSGGFEEEFKRLSN